MRNAMVQDRIKRSRTRFIESIDRDAILELASSHHQKVSCRFLKSLRHGVFNVCFFVEFESPDSLSSKDRWVVRVPIPGRRPVAWIDEKLEVEAATMKQVVLNTKIPVPQIHAYWFSSKGPFSMAFISMGSVDGQDLREHSFKNGEKWDNWKGQTEATKIIYRQLAEVYVELRKQEFPEIGALGFDGCEPSNPNPLE